MKNKYNVIMMETAKLWSTKSKCKRKKVGAVISKDNRIISVGYNGNPSGYKVKIKEEICDLCNGIGRINDIHLDDVMGINKDIICHKCGGTGIIEIKEDICETDNKTSNTVIHAEANAILFAAKEGISTKECSLYVTLSPCIECAKMIIQSGIKEVYYEEEYRNIEGIKLLNECGIKTIKLDK